MVVIGRRELFAYRPVAGRERGMIGKTSNCRVQFHENGRQQEDISKSELGHAPRKEENPYCIP